MVAATRCRMRTRGLPASRTTTARATNAAKPDSRCPFSRHPRLRGNDERGFPHSDSSLPIPGIPMFFRNLTLFRFPASLDLSEDRQRVVEGKRVSVRVDLGGRRIIKKTKNNNTTTRQYK